MFHIIEPQEHHLYQSRINLFLKELQNSMALQRDQDLNQATFILVDQEVKNITGGILLLKQSTQILSPEVRECFHNFSPYTKKVWTGVVALQMSENISGRNFEKICKILYPALYDDLIIFGVKKNIPFLYLTMPRIEHLTIDMLGSWPYIFEVRPAASSDGLFHGILALSSIKHDPSHYWKNSRHVKGSDLYSTPVFQILSAQNCSRIDTFYKKIRPILPL